MLSQRDAHLIAGKRCRLLARQNDYIHADQLVLGEPEALAYLALDPVSYHGRAHALACDRQPQPRPAQRVGTIENGKTPVDRALRLLKNPRVLMRSGKPTVPRKTR